MKVSRRAVRVSMLAFAGFGFVFACGFDDTLREYLDAHFWLPFSKRVWHFEKKNVRRVDFAFAGMGGGGKAKPIEKLRAAYQQIAEPVVDPFDPAPQRVALVAARADKSLTRVEREEVDLIDAKIDMRAGDLQGSEKKLQVFLRTAKTRAYRSEARGWLGHIYYVSGKQTAAGKIYLDELNRDGSNLSRETVLNSLGMTYGYDGGPELRAHLEEYFDTPEHAAFAIQLTTNPHWARSGDDRPRPDEPPAEYRRIKGLLLKHATLLSSEQGSSALALLGMRVALRMGDPPGALEIAAMIPGDAAVRSEPDFLWMLASVHFLSKDFAGAEGPLVELFNSGRSTDNQKSAAAYGLSGVYSKAGNKVEQIRYALWLHQRVVDQKIYLSNASDIADQSVYWASSGWDIGMLLETEASVDELEAFLNKYPGAAGVRFVRYALAVRLTREDRYAEAAEIYEAIQAVRRAPRLRTLAALHEEASRTELAQPQLLEARYKLAEFIAANPERIYFNDAIWNGLQRYALTGQTDARLTRQERETLLSGERRLQDDQEERWRAYLILRDVVRDAGKTEMGRKAARLAIRCVRGINADRFQREEELRRADIEISVWLRK